MNRAEADLEILSQRIDFLLDTFHQYREENERLKEKVSEMNTEVETLKISLVEKEDEYREVVYKLEKILS
jgi:cell division septum initiation protein DivIVA